MNSVTLLIVAILISSGACDDTVGMERLAERTFTKAEIDKEPLIQTRQYYVISPGIYPGVGGLTGGFQPNIYGINRPLGLGQSGGVLQPGLGQLGGYGIQGYQVVPQMVGGVVPAMGLATGSYIPTYGGSYGYGHGGYGYGGGHGYSGGGGHHG